MQVKELGHLVLYVADLERSVAFYGDLLGWEMVSPDGARPSRRPPSARAGPTTSCC